MLRKACYHFPTKFNHHFSAKDRCVDQCIWTAEAPCFGWRKWPYTVHSQSPLCFFFVGSIAEPKVNSWSEVTLWQLCQYWWLSLMWPSNFSWCVHSHGFWFLQVWCLTVFASTGQCVLLKFGLQDTLSYKVLKNMCNTVNVVRSFIFFTGQTFNNHNKR